MTHTHTHILCTLVRAVCGKRLAGKETVTGRGKQQQLLVETAKQHPLFFLSTSAGERSVTQGTPVAGTRQES